MDALFIVANVNLVEGVLEHVGSPSPLSFCDLIDSRHGGMSCFHVPWWDGFRRARHASDAST